MRQSIINNWFNKISLLTVLLIPFVILTVAAGVLVGYISYHNSQKAVNDVAYQLGSEINLRIEEHLQVLIDIPHRINENNADAIRREALDAGNQMALERRFWEQVRLFDTITSINFSNTDGGLANAGREGADGHLYVIATENFKSGPFHKYAVDELGNRARLIEKREDFDGRDRSWYIDAVDYETTVWSDAYILFTGQDMALSVSRPVYNSEQELLGVIASNIFLSHLSDFLSTLDVGLTGQSFIIERSGLLIATSTGEKVFSAESGVVPQHRIPAEFSNDPLTRGAAAALAEQLGDLPAINEARQFEFNLEGQRQLSQAAPFQDPYGLDWLVVTVIPETDFMAQVNANRMMTASLIIVTLLAIVTVSIVITRRILSPIALLNDSAEALSKNRWDMVVNHPSRIKEINVLTESFKYMADQMQHMISGLRQEISERQAAEEKLATLNTQLQAKNRELEQLVDIASHDLRTPLVNIDGYARELEYSLSELNRTLDEADNSESRQLRTAALHPVSEMSSALHYVRSSAVQMDALLKGLLKLSRSGRAALIIEKLDMNELIGKLAESLEFQVQEAEIDLFISDLPPCRGDAVQVSQVFSNVLGNAVKFLDPDRRGIIRISGFVEGEQAIYCVEDNGIGVDSAYLEKIFEVFERLETSKRDGDGLGLTIVRQVLGRLGGSVWAESELHSGSSFYIALPAAKS